MLAKMRGLCLCAILYWGGCTPNEPSVQSGQMTLMPADYTGVHFQNQLIDTEVFNILNYLYYYNGGGVAIGDINQDSLPDLFFTANLLPNRLYLNQGNFQFLDITEQAGVGGQNSWSTGTSMVDINGDGWLDIYVCQLGNYLDKQGHNELFINQQDGTFREASAEYGLDLVGFSTQATFFDYDRDGDLDLFQVNHSIRPSETVGDTNQRSRPDALAGDKLLRNEGGTFVEVTAASGIISSRLGYGLNVLTGDLNADGWPDLYVCNDFHEDDYLYLNQGNGRFQESLRAMMGHTSRFSMGSDLTDLNNDGRLDVMSLDMKPERELILKTAESPEPFDVFEFKRSFGYYYQYPHNAVQLNLGTGPDQLPRFAEIAQFLEVDATDWSWSALFADWNNDGAEDLYLTNGIYRRPNDMDYIKFISKPEIARKLNGKPSKEELAFIEQMPSVLLPNYVFEQTEALQLSSKTEAWGMNQAAFSNGAAYADLDLDGDLDLVVNNLNQTAFLYRNDLRQRNSLRLQLVEANGQSPAIGAKAEVWADSLYQMKELYPVRGFQSSMEPILHFGLGERTKVDSVRISWPNGSAQTHSALKAPARYTFPAPSPSAILPAKLARTVTPISFPFSHQENRSANPGGFNDFRQENLIPRLLSTEGPALAVADLNGDGFSEVFVGGAQGQAGGLFEQTPKGDWSLINAALWEEDRAYEDIDATFVDVNGDQQLDLYVVSGGNQYPAGHPLNQDRLYVQQENGQFVRATTPLPPLTQNGSCVAAADWDGDGDMDLAVGNRSIPGSYGLSPPLHLLENDGNGNYRDLAPPGDSYSGMITDLAWDDYDQDGDLDLFAVGAWMPITLYENADGILRRNELPSFQYTDGWWNTLAPVDFDQDGDTDWLVGNWGLNSPLTASKDQPCTLYVQDFDGNGATDPIICTYNEGVSYPLASKDELIGQIVSLRKQFVQYTDYAGKTVADIFPATQLASATQKQIYTFRSVYLENQGTGTYRIQALPKEAQFAPIYSFGVQGEEVLFAGNFYGLGPNLGRMDASFGGTLRWDKEQFQWLGPAETGRWIEGECREIRLLQLPLKQQAWIIAKNNAPVQWIPIGQQTN